MKNQRSKLNLDPRVVRYRAGGGRGRKSQAPPVVDMLEGRVPICDGLLYTEQFLNEVVKELKIRGYSPRSIKTYHSQLIAFFRWSAVLPNRVSRELVRNYLVFLAESGASRAKLSGALSAIRTAFDDFFCRAVTIGLATPKTRKRLPVTLDQSEVRRMIDACVSLRDKMLISLVYATGMRVSEVAKLKWADFDFARNVVLVRQGKGAKDRQLAMPESFRGLLETLSKHSSPEDFVFRSEDSRDGRHLSARTIQRVVKRVAEIAGIRKNVTPHVLRHAYATHLFESGTDIRLIQKLLGHANLDTTCIYIKVARQAEESVASPLDQLETNEHGSTKRYQFEVHTKPEPEKGQTRVTLSIEGPTGIVYFTGIIAMRPEKDVWALHIPMQEHWAEPMKQLGRRSQWFEEAAFYRAIRYRVIHTCTALHDEFHQPC